MQKKTTLTLLLLALLLSCESTTTEPPTLTHPFLGRIQGAWKDSCTRYSLDLEASESITITQRTIVHRVTYAPSTPCVIYTRFTTTLWEMHSIKQTQNSTGIDSYQIEATRVEVIDESGPRLLKADDILIKDWHFHLNEEGNLFLSDVESSSTKIDFNKAFVKHQN